MGNVVAQGKTHTVSLPLARGSAAENVAVLARSECHNADEIDTERRTGSRRKTEWDVYHERQSLQRCLLHSVNNLCGEQVFSVQNLMP